MDDWSYMGHFPIKTKLLLYILFYLSVVYILLYKLIVYVFSVHFDVVFTFVPDAFILMCCFFLLHL